MDYYDQFYHPNYRDNHLEVIERKTEINLSNLCLLTSHYGYKIEISEEKKKEIDEIEK
jgi:hypothetical protein